MIIELAEETNTGTYISYDTVMECFVTESENIYTLGFAIERYSDILNGQFSDVGRVYYYPQNLTKVIEILTNC